MHKQNKINIKVDYNCGPTEGTNFVLKINLLLLLYSIIKLTFHFNQDFQKYNITATKYLVELGITFIKKKKKIETRSFLVTNY